MRPEIARNRRQQYSDYGNLIDIELSRAHSLTNVTEEQAAAAIYSGSRAALHSTSTLQLPFHSVVVKVSNIQGFERLTTYQSIVSAARLATQEALNIAIGSNGPALMEPYMNLRVIVPDANVGDVVGDLTSTKGGVILSLTSDNANNHDPEVLGSAIYLPPDSTYDTVTSDSDLFVTISARVPLKEMIGYDKSLRSISQGRGTFIMSLEGFERMTGERALRVYGELTGVELAT